MHVDNPVPLCYVMFYSVFYSATAEYRLLHDCVLPMHVDKAAANRDVLVRLGLRLRLRLRLRFESLGLRGRSSSVGSALTQVFIPLVPRIVSSVCNG
jgi:hypothetical protein